MGMTNIKLYEFLRLILLFFAVFSSQAFCGAAAPTENTAQIPVQETTNSMVVRYYDRGAKDSRHAYKFALIKQVLEVTRPEFGDYRLAPFHDEPSYKRQAVLISEGQILNLLWASPGTVVARADVYPVPIDILKGLLGYRVCLKNPDNFPDIQKLNELDQLSIGQVFNWQDIAIYKHNGINPKPAPTFEALFDMLGAKRFQCLALGADEAMGVFREKKPEFPFLTVDSDLLIHYYYPVYLYVSKKEPLLAKRVESGLKKLQENGDFDRLFNKYHAEDLAFLNLRQRKVFCLPSPYVADDNQCDKPLELPGNK
jgi:hypothetical protein